MALSMLSAHGSTVMESSGTRVGDKVRANRRRIVAPTARVSNKWRNINKHGRRRRVALPPAGNCCRHVTQRPSYIAKCTFCSTRSGRAHKFSLKGIPDEAVRVRDGKEAEPNQNPGFAKNQ